MYILCMVKEFLNLPVPALKAGYPICAVVQY